MKARLELILLRYNRCFSYVNHVVVMLTSFYLQNKSSEVCIKARSTPTSLDTVTKAAYAFEMVKRLADLDKFHDRAYSFERNCVLRRWESETVK